MFMYPHKEPLCAGVSSVALIDSGARIRSFWSLPDRPRSADRGPPGSHAAFQGRWVALSAWRPKAASVA